MSIKLDCIFNHSLPPMSSLPIKKSRSVGLVMTYNQESTCIAAIQSLVSQTHKLDLILVSDDCSTDSTFALIQEFCEKKSTTGQIEYYKNEKNLGLISHFNLLVQKYLLSTDLVFSNSGDDESEPTRVSEFLTRYRTLGSPRYYLGHSYVISVTGEKSEIRVPPIETMKNHPGLLPVASAYHIGASQVFTGALFWDFGPILFEECYEDLTLGYRALLKDAYDFVPLPLVKYGTGGISNWQKNPLAKKRSRFCSTLTQRIVDTIKSGDLSHLSVIYDCYTQYGFSLKPHKDKLIIKVVQDQIDDYNCSTYTIADHFNILSNVCDIEVLTPAETIDLLSADQHNVEPELLWIVANRLPSKTLLALFNRLRRQRTSRVVLDIGLSSISICSRNQRDTLGILKEFLVLVPYGEVHTSCPNAYSAVYELCGSNLSFLIPLQNIDGAVSTKRIYDRKIGLVVVCDDIVESTGLLSTVEAALDQTNLKQIGLEIYRPRNCSIFGESPSNPSDTPEAAANPALLDVARYDFLIVLSKSIPSNYGAILCWWLQGAKFTIPTFLNGSSIQSEYLSHGKNSLFVDEELKSWTTAFNLINIEYEKLKAIAEEARSDAYFNLSIQKRIADVTSLLGRHKQPNPFFDKFFPL